MINVLLPVDLSHSFLGMMVSHRMKASTRMDSPNCSLKTQPAGTKFKPLLPRGSPVHSGPSTPRPLASLVGARAQLRTGARACQIPEKCHCCGVCTFLPWLVVVGLVGHHRVFPLLSLHSPCASQWLVCPSVWVFQAYCEQSGHERVPQTFPSSVPMVL